MYNWRNKWVTLLLVLSMLASGLVGCGGGEAETTAEAAGETVETVETEPVRMYLDDIGDDVKFAGEDVNIMTWLENTEYAEEITGEVVNDALYDRDLSVETRLNVNIVQKGESYTWDTKDIYLDKIRSSVLANDGAYDIASGQYATLPGLVQEGVFLDLMKQKYLDFTKTYWVQQLIEETSIAGRLYLAGGDLSLTSSKQVFCMYYNRTMQENMGIETLEDAVHAGTWTSDKLKSLIAGVYQDLDGDQAKSGPDQFGLVLSSANHLTPFIQAYNIQITTMNNEGYPELTFNTEKVVSVVEYMLSLVADSPDTAYGGEGMKLLPGCGDAFVEGRALFNVGTFSDAKNYVENMDDAFGILPLPKWDEKQEQYQTALSESNTLFGMTASCSNPDMVAATMEMMAAESSRLVTPAVFEITMKTRYAADSEMSQMFDLIKEGITFNFGSIYGFGLNQINTFFKGQIGSGKNTWASAYASLEKSAVTMIDQFYENVKALPQ